MRFLKNVPAGSKKIDDHFYWELIRKSDSAALTILFRKYYVLLFDYALKLTRQQDLAEDAVQEIFVVIWQKRFTLSEVQSVKAFLFASVRNYLLNAIKKNRRLVNHSQSMHEQLPDDAFSPEDMLIFRERKSLRKHALERALNEIPPRQREALYLKVYDGLTYKEIAPIMNVTAQVARNYVSEAYRRLSEILSSNFDV